MNRLLLAAFLLVPSACATAPKPCPDYNARVNFRPERSAEILYVCALDGSGPDATFQCIPFEAFAEAMREKAAHGEGGAGNKHSL